VIFEQESRYQFVSVVNSVEAPDTVYLKLNEGLDSFHSIYVENDVLTGGQYYDYYCLLPALAGIEKPGRVCIIGLAAGTSARQYDHFFGGPGLVMDGVEIDPVTVEAGTRFMGLDEVGSRLNIFSDRDGRLFLRTTKSSYDVIIIDAYAQQIYIPFHMATQEFFQEIHDHLAPGGIMGMNVGGFFFTDRLLTGIANTAASVFGSVSVARIPEGRNFMVYAVRGKGHVDPGTATLTAGLERLNPLLHGIREFGLTRNHLFDDRGLLLLDDHAPVECLCDADLIRYSESLVKDAQQANP
jgi:spermidine synthase